MLRDLCKKHTDLEEEDIKKLETISSMLEYFCELTEHDIFIDCFLKNEEKAVVVAHGRPKGSTLYNNDAVGQIALPQNEPTIFFARQTRQVIRDIKALTQENKTALQRTVPIKNQQGKVIGVLIEETDMTKNIQNRKKIEALGKATEQLTGEMLAINGNQNIIINQIKCGIIIFNDELSATYANVEAERIYKHANFEKNIIGRSFKTLNPSKNVEIEDIILGKLSQCECVFGEQILKVSYNQASNSNESGMVMMIEDISDIKKKDKELVQKKIAVQEMHHRIKNNLQTISSILSIQERRSGLDETRKVLKENIGRIQSIAAIHELLVTAADENINIKELLAKLTTNIKSVATTDEKDIEIIIMGEDVLLSAEVGVSIAIVINELVSNSIEHGFKQYQRGEVLISINRGMLYTTITVRDNGCGFKDIDRNKKTIGLELVEMIVKEKLGGNIEISSDEKGVTASFDFKL